MNRKRYFQELATKEKYPVGKLSPELRKALHLKDDMLPFWIYRMRILGYPPAWMKEAEMSTLDVIDLPSSSAINKSKSPFALSEEGEINDTAQYNKDSLIEFPGFNAPIPSNVKDDWLLLGMPPLIMKQQLSEAVKSMKLIEPVPYKKAKLDISGSKDDSPQSPKDESSQAETDNQHKSMDQTMSKSQQNDSKDDNNETNIIFLKDESKSELDLNRSFKTDDGLVSERKLKVISIGTPVPKSVKPNLPSLEKWAVGMGELLHFENLPTSTGAYKDKMKGIISKVRDRFNKKDDN